MTRDEAQAYLRGIAPEAIGVTPVPAKTKKVRFDRIELNSVLNQLSSIVIDSKPMVSEPTGALDDLLGANG